MMVNDSQAEALDTSEFEALNAVAYLCAGTVILLCLLAIVYLILGTKPFKYKKKTYGNSTSLTVTANRDLFSISVVASFDKETITFHRKRIRKGQSVEFVYPHSSQPAKLTVEVESGRARVFEV